MRATAVYTFFCVLNAQTFSLLIYVLFCVCIENLISCFSFVLYYIYMVFYWLAFLFNLFAGHNLFWLHFRWNALMSFTAARVYTNKVIIQFCLFTLKYYNDWLMANYKVIDQYILAFNRNANNYIIYWIIMRDRVNKIYATTAI